MENRDNLILALRPVLNLNSASGEIEQFQNKTLRPILKLQNDLLLGICKLQFVKRKSVFFELSETKQLEYIEQQIARDKNFKHLLFGIIMGQFSAVEFAFYSINEQAVRKRMTSLLIQRIQDQSHSLF